MEGKVLKGFLVLEITNITKCKKKGVKKAGKDFYDSCQRREVETQLYQNQRQEVSKLRGE